MFLINLEKHLVFLVKDGRQKHIKYWNKLINTRTIWLKTWLTTIQDFAMYCETKITIEYELLKIF